MAADWQGDLETENEFSEGASVIFLRPIGVAYDPTMADTAPVIERGDLFIRFWPHGVDIPFGWEHLDVRPQNRQRICRMADGTERWNDGIYVYKKMILG